MRTLVINLTRFGDLLQTQPVLSGFKAAGHEVGLVCLENFMPASTLLKDVDRAYGLPGAKFLAALDKNWRRGLEDFWKWGVSGLKDFRPDLVVNLTSSVTARLLSGFVSNKEQRGFCIDDHGFGVHTNPWAAFLMASSRHRGASPFNLVDLFLKAAELPVMQRELELKRPLQDAIEQSRKILHGRGPEGDKGFVGLQLGASSPARRWPVEHFASLADFLWRDKGLCPVLLGGSGEQELGKRFVAVADCPCIDLIGGTSLEQLAAMLVNMEMLVTNDTGTMHLAAGLGTPVVAIFLATAQPWDTGPYRSGCLCLEPDAECHPCAFSVDCPRQEACRGMIAPGAVYEFVRNHIEGRGWKDGHSKGVRAWVTGMDEYGFMDLGSLTGHEDADRSIWIRMQRAIYRQFLDRGDAESLSWNGPRLSDAFTADLLKELQDSERILFLMLEQIRLLGKTSSEHTRKKFLGNWQRLGSRWIENQRLSVLGDLWREQSQIVTGDLHNLERLVLRYMSLTSAFISFLRNGGMVIE